ncbi:hypothetical protein GLE_3288 [Lysobacter enzymogenes]|uniref:Uncharacterized protein n=1 Tax=Lysobacter enzymogenes TaxID=69 RepID=A0A0S2DJB8_LYSEN|nr:hypothetical protein GLE_3288 [Lysobacter enzymogenes]
MAAGHPAAGSARALRLRPMAFGLWWEGLQARRCCVRSPRFQREAADRAI